MFFKFLFVLVVNLYFYLVSNSQAEGLDINTIERVANVTRSMCLAGTQYEIEVNGDGSLSLLKKLASGAEIKFRITQNAGTGGALNYKDENKRLDADHNILICIEKNLPLFLRSAGARLAITPSSPAGVFASGGLQVTEGTASTNKQTGNLSVSFYVTNGSQKTLRLFIGERATAFDTTGNNWEAYNVNNTVGIWACMNNVNNDCLRRKLDEVEQNATIMSPGDKIHIVITMVLKANKIQYGGETVSLSLNVHAQELKEDKTKNSPWYTIQLGPPNIPLTN